MVKHLNPKYRAQERITGMLVCTQCHHASNAHVLTRPKYKGMEGRELYDMILATGSKSSGGFNECEFYECGECSLETMGLSP